MILCPKCLKAYHARVNFCPACNVPLPKAGQDAPTGPVAEPAVSPTATTVALDRGGGPPPPSPVLITITQPTPPGDPAPAATDSAPARETPSVAAADKAAPQPGVATAERIGGGATAHPETETGEALREVAEALAEAREEVEFVTMGPREPMALTANLNRVLVEGAGVVVGFKIACRTAEPLHHVHLQVASDKVLSHSAEEHFPIVEPSGPGECLLELELRERSMGTRMLNCTVAATQLGHRKTFRGQLCVTILKEPSSTNLRLDLSNIGNQVISGAGNAGLGADHRHELRLAELVDFSKIRTLNDLLSSVLPDTLVSVSLRQISDEPTGSRTIASPFLKKSQPATVLNLEHAGADGALPLRISARPEFVFGRQRDACDLVTWFLPRNALNDNHTRSLSKVHALAALGSNGVLFRTRTETNGANLNGTPLDSIGPGVPLLERARLDLTAAPGVSFHIDMHHHAAAGSKPPVAENARLWPGPAEEPKPVTGCVIFRPVKYPTVLRHCIWLFTEAAFGSGEDNPLYLPDCDLASVQGRIHHYRRCFWIENSAETGAVIVDGHRLRPGDLAPLCGGMDIKLGNLAFKVRIED